MRVNIESDITSQTCFKMIADGEIKKAGFVLHNKSQTNKSPRSEMGDKPRLLCSTSCCCWQEVQLQVGGMEMCRASLYTVISALVQNLLNKKKDSNSILQTSTTSCTLVIRYQIFEVRRKTHSFTSYFRHTCIRVRMHIDARLAKKAQKNPERGICKKCVTDCGRSWHSCISSDICTRA